MPNPSSRYDRRALGAGVAAWVYEYVNTSPAERGDAMATGLELGVQLQGDWLHHGARSGSNLYGPRSVHGISPAERYALSCTAKPYEAGLQVGFIVYPDEIPGFAAEDHDLAFVRGMSLDRAFFDFCRAYQVANDAGRPLPEQQARAEVLRFASARVEAVAHDPLARAKRELDRSYAQALYLEHLADVAAMHPRTFARRFAVRYGATPIAYRLRLRLNEAARLTWSSPDVPVRGIAARVGFEDVAYFYRAFLREFGVTPTVYGRRTGDGGARRPNQQERVAMA